MEKEPREKWKPWGLKVPDAQTEVQQRERERERKIHAHTHTPAALTKSDRV